MANLLRKGHKNIYNSWVVCLSAFQALFMPCGSFIALHRKTYFFHKYLQFPWGQCFPKVPSFSKCPQIDFAQMRQLVLLKLSHLLSITNLSTQLSTITVNGYFVILCHWRYLSFKNKVGGFSSPKSFSWNKSIHIIFVHTAERCEHKYLASATQICSHFQGNAEKQHIQDNKKKLWPHFMNLLLHSHLQQTHWSVTASLHPGLL